MNGLFRTGTALLLMTAALLGCVSCSDDEPNSIDKLKLESITYQDNRMYSFKYDTKGRLKEYIDYFMLGKWEITYDPITIKVTYYKTSSLQDQDIYYTISINDVALNSDGFIESFSQHSTTLNEFGKEQVYEYKATASYNKDGRLSRLSWNDQQSIEITWGSKGELLKSQNADYENNYTTTTVENKGNVWIPVWYVCNGLEMTGLLGNAPAYLPATGDQTFTNGTTSMAKFVYKMNVRGMIETLDFTEDENPGISLSFNYLRQL